jgi:ketosteroid isomerase-like protein
MLASEQVVREVYAAAETSSLDLDRFVSLFAEDGYFLDMASGQKWVGAEVRQPIEGLGATFPEFHRELLNVHVGAQGFVFVELKLQGIQGGDFPLPTGGVLPGSGSRFDVPCCDIFHVENGKVAAFHCYNMRSMWLEQLGAVYAEQ